MAGNGKGMVGGGYGSAESGRKGKFFPFQVLLEVSGFKSDLGV